MPNPVLIVEDDSTVLDFIAFALKGEGHEVLTAATVGEARARLANRTDAARFSLIIDVVLENESGIDFAQEMLKQHPDFHVLFVSGFTDDVVVVEPEHAGRTAFLGKPFTKQDLMVALGRVCQ